MSHLELRTHSFRCCPPLPPRKSQGGDLIPPLSNQLHLYLQSVKPPSSLSEVQAPGSSAFSFLSSFHHRHCSTLQPVHSGLVSVWNPPPSLSHAADSLQLLPPTHNLKVGRNQGIQLVPPTSCLTPRQNISSLISVPFLRSHQWLLLPRSSYSLGLHSCLPSHPLPGLAEIYLS